MNTQTGEIHRDPSPELIKEKNLVPLTPNEVEMLSGIPESKRAEAWNTWREIAKETKFKTLNEKLTARKYFYLGFEAANI